MLLVLSGQVCRWWYMWLTYLHEVVDGLLERGVDELLAVGVQQGLLLTDRQTDRAKSQSQPSRQDSAREAAKKQACCRTLRAISAILSSGSSSTTCCSLGCDAPLEKLERFVLPRRCSC